MLRVGSTGPDRDAVDRAVDVWRVRHHDAVDVQSLAWPVDLDVAAGRHLVVGVASGDAPADDAVDVWIAPDAADDLWCERIEPFAVNLAAGRRAPRRRVAELVGPDPQWPAHARRLIARIRHAAAADLVRVDHIGSTSVPGLPAKDVVDVQVVVRDLDTAGRVAARATDIGVVDVGRWDAPDRTGTRFAEQVLVDADPHRPTNVNLRPVGDPVWRETLLFRDWLRADAARRVAYLAEKRRLERGTDHVDAYGAGKLGWISAALSRAEDWASTTGWSV